MANGIEIFREYFSKYKEQYTLIGGMACNLLMSDAELDFRQTKDIDMVLIVEAMTNEFASSFWHFIEEGGYEMWKNRFGKPVFYRFINAKVPDYPYMIELFARPDNKVDFDYTGHLIPLHIDDDISSLSAILLNEDYYNFLLQGRTISEDISVLDVLHIIPLKMKAWIDLTNQKKTGIHVNDRDIRKHKQDVFRLFKIVNPDAKIATTGQVYVDIRYFINKMREENIDLKSMDIKKDKDFILEVYEAIYITEH